MSDQTPLKPDDALPRLLRYCHLRSYPGKILLNKPGDMCDTLYYVVKGSCAVSLSDKDDVEEIVLTYLNKGTFIGEVGVFVGPMVREVNVRTREPSQLAEISYKRLYQLLETELSAYATSILNILARQICARLLETNRKVFDLAFLDVSGRIAHALIELSNQPDAMTHPDGMQIRVTRQELGRIVGCSREMAGRVLKILEAQKLIAVRGKTIVVLGDRNTGRP